MPREKSASRPAVSVLMPCYNAAETVDAAVQSILDQSLASLELVAVDDGSSDATLSKLQDWAARDDRVRVVPRGHGGIIEALNAGLAACQAELVARMDADDLSDPGRLEAQVQYLHRRDDIAVAGCLVEAFSKRGVREGYRAYLRWQNSLVEPEAIAREIYVESPLVHPSVMARRDWLERAGGYQDHGWPEDYDLWLRLHLSGASFGKVGAKLYRWREEPERLTRTDSRYSVENFLRAKAHYLMLGPLGDRDAVIVWGAGPMGRRLSKHLLREGAPLAAFVDIDPAKIGRTRRDRPIIPPEELLTWLARCSNPAVLSAVGSHEARGLIRERLAGMGLNEGEDWWAAA